MKVLARLSFLLIAVLWGSFYAVTKEALGRMDPVVFTFFEALVLAPVALALIGIYRNELNSSTLKRGILLGSWLCLGFLTMSVSLKFTQATNTAFFPSIGGVFGAIITGVFLKRPLGKSTRIAGGISLAGILLILLMSGNGWTFRGDLIALLGALFITTYTFLVDHDRRGHDPQQGEQSFWLILGIEHLTLAFWMTLIALLFGDWQHFHPVFPKDIIVIVYVATAVTFIPIVLSIFMQKHIAPLEVAFISTLEPFWGVVFAFIYLRETVSLPIYIGGALVIAGAIIHTCSESGFATLRKGTTLSLPIMRHAANSPMGMIAPPMLLWGAAFALLYRIGGLPPGAWSEVWRRWSDFPTLISQGQETFVIVLCLQAFFWLACWAALVTLGIRTVMMTARRLLASRSEVQQVGVAEAYQLPDAMLVSTTALKGRVTRRLTSPVAQRRQARRVRRLGISTSLPAFSEENEAMPYLVKSMSGRSRR